MMTIGQHGHTEIVADKSQHINPNHFLLGPKVADVSPKTVSVLVYLTKIPVRPLSKRRLMKLRTTTSITPLGSKETAGS